MRTRGSSASTSSPNALFFYFDGAPNFGFMADGIMNVTLKALRVTRGPEGVVRDRVEVAHLKPPAQAGRAAIARPCWSIQSRIDQHRIAQAAPMLQPASTSLA
jgi:hypothetical protein